MTIVFPNMVPARAEIHLDMVDSLGGPVLEMRQNSARPMALSRRGGELWYGFVINDSTVDVILPDERVACVVSFLNHEDAQHAFPRGASILFGDGVSTRGVLRLK
nr:hypothetical protein [Stenotrophomonas pavanii]